MYQGGIVQKYKLILMLTISMLFGLGDSMASTIEDRKEAIKKMETYTPSEEQIRRKARSESILKAEKVPYIEHLPVIESETEANIQDENEVELRALCLVVVAVKGEGLEQEVINDLVSRYGLAKHLTPKEKAFINDPSPTQHDKIQFVWRYESAWVMLWALGFIEELPRPDQIADVPKLAEIVRSNTTESFQKKGKLRKPSELLDQADLIYRYHWAVTDARINGREPPAGLDGSVVYERHYSLNWLIGYMDEEWDDISTDT
jgi:hypothetical protein